jgi:hypothetical protein
VLNRMALIALAESLERTYPVLSESLAQFAETASEAEIAAFAVVAPIQQAGLFPPDESDHDAAALVSLRTVKCGEAERKRWFEQWWAGAVWCKIGKAEAQRAYLRAVKTTAMRDKVFKAAKEQTSAILRRAASTPSGTPIYPATWLNQGRWDDEPVEIPEVASKSARDVLWEKA